MLRSTDPNCTLHVRDGRATFNFVLTPLAANRPRFATRAAAILARCGSEETPVPALCSPVVAKFLRFEVLLAVTLLLLYGCLRCVACCCCRRSSGGGNKKSTTKKTKKA